MSHILTIDGGPTHGAHDKIAFLNDCDLPSIWFCLGENLEKNSEAALFAIKASHVIANHSFSHPHFSEISKEDAREEIERTEIIIEELYKQTEISRPSKLFRFPYGDQGQNKDRELSHDLDTVEKKAKLQRFLLSREFSPLNTSDLESRDPFINQPGESDWLWSYDIQEWAIHNDNPRYQLTRDQVMTNLRKYLSSFDKKKDQIVLTHDHEETTDLF